MAGLEHSAWREGYTPSTCRLSWWHLASDKVAEQLRACVALPSSAVLIPQSSSTMLNIWPQYGFFPARY